MEWNTEKYYVNTISDELGYPIHKGICRLLETLAKGSNWIEFDSESAAREYLRKKGKKFNRCSYCS